MSRLKWFAGGKSRKDEALFLIKELVDDLKDNSESQPLKDLLLAFDQELKAEKSSIPFILSRLNVSLSRVLTEHKIKLTDSQADKVKQIQTLSQIRYGY